MRLQSLDSQKLDEVVEELTELYYDEGYWLAVSLNQIWEQLVQKLIVLEEDETLQLHSRRILCKQQKIGLINSDNKGFYMVVEKDPVTNIVHVSYSRSTFASNYMIRMDKYCNNEVRSVVRYVYSVLDRKILSDGECVVKEPSTNGYSAYNLLQQALLSQIGPDMYNVALNPMYYIYNNLTPSHKIQERVNPLFLSQEVREGSPFSIKKSLEKLFGEYKLEEATGIILMISYDRLCQYLLGNPSVSEDNSDLPEYQRVVEKIHADVTNYLMYLTKQSDLINPFTQRSIYKFFDQCKMPTMVNSQTAMVGTAFSQYVYVYKITQLDAEKDSPLIGNMQMRGLFLLKEFLQPATEQEALDDIPVFLDRITLRHDYGQWGWRLIQPMSSNIIMRHFESLVSKK